MDEKARQKQLGDTAGFPKNIRAEDIISVLRNVAAPRNRDMEPVAVSDVLRANRAVALMQKAARRRQQQRRLRARTLNE